MMRLLEAIVDANHRALAGDANAGLHPTDFENELPLAALTCIDTRLNAILPQVLGVPPEQFIWLRNAGNIVTGPTSSTIRSLALACAVKGAKEIAIIGHSDCQVAKTTTMQLIDRLRELGIERHLLPDNLNEFFGMFGSERQNVLKAVEIVRSSPLIGPKTPVHGLLVDIQSGKLEWLVNGYESLGTARAPLNEAAKSAEQTLNALKSLGDFKIGGVQVPATKIGEIVTKAENWASEKVHELETRAQTSAFFKDLKIAPSIPPAAPPAAPPKLPLPPPLRPRMPLRRGPK